MAEIILSTKPLSVNPLKVSQPVGAALAFLGLAQSMPLEHGARGCASFNKLFFMRHFREPIALQTTAMDQVTTIIGADDNVVEALATIAAKNRPAVVGLITTGLSSTQGADIPRTVKAFRAAHPEYAAMAVVPVTASDTLGNLESGFALAVEAIIADLVPAEGGGPIRRPHQVNLLASSMLTPGDIEEIKSWIEAFGLSAIVLPDLADSLDGHLIDAGFATLTYGGTARADIARMGESIATLVVGPSLDRAADLLAARTGISDYRFAGLMGLEACDAFTDILHRISGRPVPATLLRRRAQLQDAMVDCQFQIGGTRVAVAADPDLLGSLLAHLGGVGAEVVAAVASARDKKLARLAVDKVVIGDLEDLETLAAAGRAELLITNSHGAEVAGRLGLPLLRAGFPLYDIYGGAAEAWVGYRGSRRVLFDIANLALFHHHKIAPHRSIYWQGTPRAIEPTRS